MKKTQILIAIFTLTLISCKAQIIAVEDYNDYPNDIPDGAYIKDINNVLPKFVGAWKGSFNDKNYEFEITKETISYLGIKEDQLLMRYKITDNLGNEIENTLSLPNDDGYVMQNGYINKNGGYVFSYIGREVACGQNGVVYIGLYKTNSNKMFLRLSPNGEMYPECITGEAEQILPLDWIDLTKQ